MTAAPNTTPPPESSNLWLNLAGYSLFILQAGFEGFIVANYAIVARKIPGARRLLPLHILLISIGTLTLSGVSIARAIQFPRPVWGIATLIPVAMINVALYLVLAWQRRGRPGATIVASRR